jgi:hypothetical protein
MTHRLSTCLARAILGLTLVGAGAPAALAGPGTCKTDATDACERPGLACNPPKGGKCVTISTPVPLSAPKLSCECQVPPPPPAPANRDAGRAGVLNQSVMGPGTVAAPPLASPNRKAGADPQGGQGGAAEP